MYAEQQQLKDSGGNLIDPATKGNQDTLNTKIDTLNAKDFSTSTKQDVLSTKIGEVQDTPTAYTLLARLKDIWTLLSGILTIQGSVASGGSDSGNPVKMGGVQRTTQPTLADGQRGDMQLDTRGNLRVALISANGTTAVNLAADNADGVAVSSTTNKMQVLARLSIFNGTTWDRLRGDTTNGIWANIKSSVIPTGASTEAKQDTLIAKDFATSAKQDTGNTNTSKIPDQLAQYKFSDEDTSVAGTVYRGYVDKDGNWFIVKEVITATARTYRYFKGDATYASNKGYEGSGTGGWAYRASITYDYFHIIF